MGRSRADEILREWSTVAKNSHRPDFAPRPQRQGVRALTAGLIAAAVVILLCVAVIGPLLAGPGPVAASPSPSASSPFVPMPTWTLTPFWKATPTESPTPAVTRVVSDATVVGRIANCASPLGWSYTVSGSDLYMICYGSNVPDSDDHPYIARVDLATNKVKATYGTDLLMTYSDKVAVADGNLWYDVTLGSACIPPKCDGFHRLERFDVATGKRTLDRPNVELEGYAAGYLWVRYLSSTNTNSKGQLIKLDPKTGAEVARIPFTMDVVQFACGSLWGLTTSDWTMADEKTTVARIDPSDGRILASFVEPGRLSPPQSVGSECWARARSRTANWPGYDYPDHLVRIGQSGIEDRSPSLVPTDQGDTATAHVAILEGTFWLVTEPAGPDEITVTLQRLDPSTWQPSGTTWRCVATGYRGDELTGIDGSIWTYDNDGGVSRLAIPAGE
jgi:hypothetical protein